MISLRHLYILINRKFPLLLPINQRAWLITLQLSRRQMPLLITPKKKMTPYQWILPQSKLTLPSLVIDDVIYDFADIVSHGPIEASSRM